MSVSKKEVAALYVAVYNRAPDAEGLEYWANSDVEYSVLAEQFINGHPQFEVDFGDKTNEEFVKAIYLSVLGQEGDAKGIEYWTNELDGGATKGDFLANFINGAFEEIDPESEGAAEAQERQDYLNNRVEVALYFAEKLGENSNGDVDSEAYKLSKEILEGVTADKATVEAAREAINNAQGELTGKTFFLTEGADRDVDAPGGFLTGTNGNDTFIADVIQSNGQQVNTLGSGDRLDGGAGNDTLLAEVAGQTHVSGGNQQIQAKTQNIENIKLQAVASDIDTKLDSTTESNDVVVSAKDMVGVNYIGSNYSDANLIITDVNTKANQNYDSARNLNEMTIGMTYTGNQDTNWDASDLNVYFDQDFIKPSVYGKLSVALDLMNEDAYDQKLRDPSADIKFLDGVYIDKMAFTLNGKSFDLAPYIQEITGENKASNGNIIRDYDDLLAAVEKAIAQLKADNPGNAALQSLKAELNGPFFSDISPENGLLREGTRLVLTVDNDDNAGNTLEVKSGDLTLNRADEATVENNNRYERADKFDPETESVVETNVHLEKVGRQGDGGTLVIGSMFKDSENVWSDKYAGKGIEKFNVTVTGNEDKTNSLAGLHSTGNNLKHVTVTSTERADGSYADLIIGNSVTEKKVGEGKLGSLSVNQEALKDVQTFDATGFKGDLTVYAALTDEVTEKYLANGGETVDFVYAGGEGNDTFNLVLDPSNLTSKGTATHGDFTLAINSGKGDDIIEVTIPDEGVTKDTPWYANQSENANLSINAGEGNDTVQINGSGDWKVNLGAGDDVIYVDNSGEKASWIFNATEATPSADNSWANAIGGGNETHNLYKAGVSITFTDAKLGVFELNLVVAPDAVNGNRTTQKAINNAIKDAIANDTVFSKLLEAKTGTHADSLVIDSLIDGLLTDLKIVVEQAGNGITVDAFNTKYGTNITTTELNNAATALPAVTLDATSANTALTTGAKQDGKDSNATIGAQTIEGGKGDDVLVLGTDGDQTHTLVYKGFENGNDTIVNYISSVASTVADKIDLSDYKAKSVHTMGDNANANTAAIKAAVDGLAIGKHVVFNESNTNNGEYTVTVWEKTASGVTELGTVGVLDFGKDISFDNANFVLTA